MQFPLSWLGIFTTYMPSSPTNKPEVVPASVRADGSVRKERRIRPGYVNPELAKKYKVPGKRRQEEAKPKDVRKDTKHKKNIYIPPHLRHCQQTQQEQAGEDLARRDVYNKRRKIKVH